VLGALFWFGFAVLFWGSSVVHLQNGQLSLLANLIMEVRKKYKFRDWRYGGACRQALLDIGDIGHGQLVDCAWKAIEIHHR
jgi:hypothetical protein